MTKISERYVERAEVSIRYFSRLVENDGDRWMPGLAMAKWWRGLLESDELDEKEIRQFVEGLEAERVNQGSEWLDLCISVRNWVEERGRG